MENIQKKEPAAKQSSYAQTIPQKSKTIKLQGKDYAQVSARVAEFHKLWKNGSISTEYEFKEGYAIFKAKLVIDVKNESRVFTGTSLGKTNGIKAFEKLETIAVGRALAFAGFLSDGEIASSEEMAKYEESPVVVESDAVIARLNQLKTLQELKKVWLELTPDERANPEVFAAKDRIKEFLPNDNSPSGTEEPRLAPITEGKDNRNGVKKDSRDTSSKK